MHIARSFNLLLGGGARKIALCMVIKMLLIHYPKCTTCRKAVNWLKEQNIEYVERDIKADNPTEEELKQWIKISGLPVKRFFNTSGMIYRELGLKDKLADMSEEEQIRLLASDGMLVKRPILVGEDSIFVGFKEKEWKVLSE